MERKEVRIRIVLVFFFLFNALLINDTESPKSLHTAIFKKVVREYRTANVERRLYDPKELNLLCFHKLHSSDLFN